MFNDDLNFATIPSQNKPSRGFVVRTTQIIEDEKTRQYYGQQNLHRRYILYIPEHPLSMALPVVFAFHGYNVNAETIALLDTRNRFEDLADIHKFIVVYPQGLGPTPGMRGISPAAGFSEHGYFQSCFAPHDGEGIDVRFTRQILRELSQRGLNIDHKRIYATGLSAGGGMAFSLAIEAPDLVAAIAPVVPIAMHLNNPPHPFCCHAHPDVGSVSILMLASTDDPILPYTQKQPDSEDELFYSGMEQARDSWLKVMEIKNEPHMTRLPQVAKQDSYEPHSGIQSSYIEVYQYPAGPSGQNFVYYKVVGGGHTWPHPQQIPSTNWHLLGKNNQDIDFADHAWKFFQQYNK